MTGAPPPAPFPGERPYRADEGHLFFGREREAGDVAALWLRSPLTVVHGPAGAGLSSLLAAGVLPRLRGERGTVAHVAPLVMPADHPSGALTGPTPDEYALIRGWAPHLRAEAAAETSLGRALAGPPRPPRLLLAVDQAENAVRARTTGALRELLGETARRHPTARLLLAVRSEHLAPLLGALPGAPATYRLPPLRPGPAAAALAAAVAATGVRRIAPAAVAALAGRFGRRNDAPVPGSLVQDVAHGLWDAWPPGEPAAGPDTFAGPGPVRWAAAGIWRAVCRTAALHDREPADLVAALAADPGPERLGDAVAATLTDRHLLADGALAGPALTAPLRLLARSADEREPYVPSAADWLDDAAHARATGSPDLAAHAALRALTAADRPVDRLTAELLLGDLARDGGRYADAEARYRQAAQSAETLGRRALVGALLTAVGRLRLASGDSPGAARLLHAATDRTPGVRAPREDLERLFAAGRAVRRAT
ncbi:hypothetical protein [Actinomadura flavalba]|uniref:nSTAND1 domain-containing NTPase n=1 Tax=Actinomadura flavalba TaxID=1120938 RepID=UPI000378B234|nr:hypothetical protein [Actinomadura flavalba]